MKIFNHLAFGTKMGDSLGMFMVNGPVKDTSIIFKDSTATPRDTFKLISVTGFLQFQKFIDFVVN